MLTTIEVTIDKTGHLHPVESSQSIKPGRAADMAGTRYHT